MKKSALFAWIFTATLFSGSPLTSLPVKAEGGCPKGFFPIGGGYCRNIVCKGYGFATEQSTIPVMKKYGYACPVVGNIGNWGTTIIPMR